MKDNIKQMNQLKEEIIKKLETVESSKSLNDKGSLK